MNSVNSQHPFSGCLTSSLSWQMPTSAASSVKTASYPVASGPRALWWSTGTSNRSQSIATTTVRTSLDCRTNTSVEERPCSTLRSLTAMPPCSWGGSKYKTRAGTSAIPAHGRATRRSLSVWVSEVSTVGPIWSQKFWVIKDLDQLWVQPNGLEF